MSDIDDLLLREFDEFDSDEEYQQFLDSLAPAADPATVDEADDDR